MYEPKTAFEERLFGELRLLRMLIAFCFALLLILFVMMPDR